MQTQVLLHTALKHVRTLTALHLCCALLSSSDACQTSRTRTYGKLTTATQTNHALLLLFNLHYDTVPATQQPPAQVDYGDHCSCAEPSNVMDQDTNNALSGAVWLSQALRALQQQAMLQHTDSGQPIRHTSMQCKAPTHKGMQVLSWVLLDTKPQQSHRHKR
jgi:hypothetical protein